MPKWITTQYPLLTDELFDELLSLAYSTDKRDVKDPKAVVQAVLFMAVQSKNGLIFT